MAVARAVKCLEDLLELSHVIWVGLNGDCHECHFLDLLIFYELLHIVDIQACDRLAEQWRVHLSERLEPAVR